MPLITEMVRTDSLDFKNQRKVMNLRAGGAPWRSIARQVVNLKKKRPSHSTCRRVHNRFSKTKNRCPFKYANCGRSPWKMTPEVKAFLLRRLRSLRKTSVCTSATLQAVLAKERKIVVSSAHIRKVLLNSGYKWLRRSQKMIYNSKDKKARVAWAKRVLRMSQETLDESLNMCMDGVVLPVPPEGWIDRINFCRHGDQYMWRRPGEAGAAGLPTPVSH